MRAAYRVTRGGIARCRAQRAATLERAERWGGLAGWLAGWMDGWMRWLSPGLPAPPLAPKSEVMTERIPKARLGKVPIAGVH